MIRGDVDGTQGHHGDGPSHNRECRILTRDWCITCWENFSGTNEGYLLMDAFSACLLHELSLGDRAMRERVLYHRLELPPRVPEAAVHIPLGINKHTVTQWCS